MPTHLPRIALAIFWLLFGIATYLLLMEQPPSQPTFPHLDKVIHFCLFATLTAIGYLAYTKHRTWLCLGLISYGAITEVLQGACTLTRSASLYDWLADTAGVLLCFFILNKLTPHFLKHYDR